MASFSFWALRKASLKRLASVEEWLVFALSEADFPRELTLSVGESNGQSLSLWLSLRNISNSGPDPGSVGSDVWSELHVADNCELSVSTVEKHVE
jgi:hypothetical protein